MSQVEAGDSSECADSASATTRTKPPTANNDRREKQTRKSKKCSMKRAKAQLAAEQFSALRWFQQRTFRIVPEVGIQLSCLCQCEQFILSLTAYVRDQTDQSKFMHVVIAPGLAPQETPRCCAYSSNGTLFSYYHVAAVLGEKHGYPNLHKYVSKRHLTAA